MATSLFPRVDELTFDNFTNGDIVCRVQDGSTRTHRALGIVAAQIGGECREYRFAVDRHFYRRTVTGMGSTEYWCALYLDGREIPDGKLMDVRAAVVRQFKAHVRCFAEAVYA